MSQPQAAVLALWSLGTVLVQTGSVTAVSEFLALWLGQKPNSVRQRLREWTYAAADKQGDQRAELDVTASFAPLLRWVLAWWPASEGRLALALDATHLGSVFVVLVVSVVYRGCAIPVAWQVLPAQAKGSWRPVWTALLRHLQPAVPADWCVVVLADRGLYAPWLFATIQAVGWHPFLRLNLQGAFRPVGQARFRNLRGLLRRPGQSWSGAVRCFKTHPIVGTLLARWDAGYAEPWLILTDLPVTQASATWYSLRTWIERGFKFLKSAGWQWHTTRMTDPARAQRVWLVLAVATLWALSVGGEAAALAALNLPPAEPTPAAPATPAPAKKPRRMACFRRGVLLILIALLTGHRLPLGRFYPEPWPS